MRPSPGHLSSGSLRPTHSTTEGVSGTAQTPRASQAMPGVRLVVARGERNGGVRRRTEGEGAKLSTPHPRAPPNRALTSLLPQAVPLSHGLEHPLGPELVQVIAINHDLGEVRGFQNLQLEHGFAHLLDVWDSRSAWTCLGMKMSAPTPGGPKAKTPKSRHRGQDWTHSPNMASSSRVWT